MPPESFSASIDATMEVPASGVAVTGPVSPAI